MFDLINEITPALLTLLAALLTFTINRVAVWVQQRMHIEIEAKHREALHSAIMSGIRAAILARPGDRSTDARAAIVEQAIEHARISVPDALNHLKPTPAILKNLGDRFFSEAIEKLH